MFNFLKKQTIEIYVLVILPLVWIAALIVFNPYFWPNFKTSSAKSLGFYAFFGGPFYKLAFLFLYNYLVVKACLFLKDLWQAESKKEKISSANLSGHLKSWLLVFLPISITGLANGLATWNLSWAPAEKVALASFLANNWDYKVFGVYPAFWLQKFSGLIADTILINAYQGLTIVFPVIFFNLLMFKKVWFRQFALATLMAPMIAYPFWRFWPTISPNEMFRYNITKSEIPASIQNELKLINFTETQEKFDRHVEDFWIDKTGRTFAVTAFPSMHAAWGIISAYFGILLWKPLAIILIPWAIFNSLGAVYTLQHYGVDMIAGTLVGVLTIFIAIFLVRFEKKYLTSTPDVFLMIDTFQKDCRSLIEILVKTLRGIFAKLRIKF